MPVFTKKNTVTRTVLDVAVLLIGGGGGNLPSSPANAPACALSFAGSQQCCSNSLLTPHPYRTRIHFPMLRNTKEKAQPCGWAFSFVGGGGGN